MQCDMKKECDKEVKYIDNKGFLYCEVHGLQRKAHVPCRKLTGAEIRLLAHGQQIRRY